jgi:CubicO group peptidase (beta-lactamase class C family)
MVMLSNKKQLRLFALMILLLLSSSAMSLADGVDEYIEAQMKKRKIPGLALAVARAGEIVKAEGYGFADLEHNAPATPNTMFQSGSVGKQFTAFAVMMLVEEGGIGLDDPVCRRIDGSPDIWKDVTVRHLLTHTSGIREYSDLIDLRRDYTEKDMLGLASEQPLDFAPGEHWSYSNTGYVLLGMIIRDASGLYWGDYVHERIFTPLHMETARVISEDDIIPNRASGYRLVDGEIKNQEWVSPSLNSTADGALYVSVLDLVKWDAGLYTRRLLARESIEKMWTPTRLSDGRTVNYGFGWWIKEINGHKVVAHSGSWQGFQSYIARYVDDSLTVVTLANQADARLALIAHNVAGFYDPELRPIERKAIALSKESIGVITGRYELPSRKIVGISSEDGRLFVSYGDGPNKEFFAESGTVIFSREEDSKIEFIKNDKGEVLHLLFDRGVVERALKISGGGSGAGE